MVLRKEIASKILDLLRQNPQGLNITAIVRNININRNTAGRYLENLMVSGQVEMRRFGMAKIYRLARRVPLSAMLSISSELIMLLDSGMRVVYANDPLLRFCSATQKDIYGKNIEYTPVVTVFDDAFDTVKKQIRAGIAGKEWHGELPLPQKGVVFACRIAPAVFEGGQRGASVLLENITERKEAERTIRESERQFRLLAENSLDMIHRHTPDDICIYISPASKPILGYDPEEIIGQSIYKFLNPDDAPLVPAYKSRLTNKNPVAKITYRVRHRDGHDVWLESVLRAIFDEKTGEFAEIYGVTRDITEQRKAQETLRESEAQYRSLAEASQDLIFMVDRNDIVTYVNSFAAAMLGKDPHEVIGKVRASLFPADLAGRQGAGLHRVFASGRPERSEGPMPVSGDVRWFDHFLVPVADAGGRVVSVLGVSRDITGRKETGEALRQSEGKLNAMLQSITDPMTMMDENLTILWANDTAKRYFGAGIVGMKCYEAFHQRLSPCEPSPCLTLRAFADGTMHRHETTVIDREGTTRFFDCTANVALRDEHGRPAAVLEISRDCTGLKRAEEALHQETVGVRDPDAPRTRTKKAPSLN
jgi:PAS domain S-box-containing protein